MTEEDSARRYLIERRRYLALKHRQIIQKARTDVNTFAEYCFNDESTGLPIIQQPFHRAWHKHADENQRALIIGPRGHGKTENFAVFRPLWLLGNDPNLRIKVVSADKETAKKRVSCIKQHIERNERVHAVFPGLRCAPDETTWSSYAIAVQRERILKEPSVEARGITQTGEGGRCDILIGEDVCDSNNTLRVPGMRDIVKRAWHNTWENLLDPGKGRVVYIGTLWHKCIPDGTLVATDKGLIPVEHVSIGTPLRVAPGTMKPPIAIEKSVFIGDLVEVVVHGQGEVYRFTPNHRLPTQRGVVEAGGLTLGDSLVLQTGPVFYPIESIRGVPYQGYVYDIQTSTGYFDLAGITSHNSDLTHELLQNTEYKALNISIGANDEPIWPAKWPKAKLLRQKRQIGRVNYDRGYRNLAVSDEDRIFDKDRVREACERGVRMWRNKLPPEWPRYTGVDLAIGKGAMAKYSVIFTFAHDTVSQKRYVVDIKRGQWSSPRLAEQVFTAYQEHRPALIAVENNSYQAALIEWITEKYGADLPIVGMTTGGEKHDLDVGIPGFSLQFDDGLWTIPQDGEMHPEDCSCSRCEWCEELEDYPAGKFTDAVMASWLADKACRFRRTNMLALGAVSVANTRLSDTASDTLGLHDSLLLPGNGPFIPDW